MHILPLLVILVLLVCLVFLSIVITQTSTNKIVERFGKYHHTTSPGLSFIIPVVDRVVAVMNLRVQQLDVDVETKTKDNVFVDIPVAVQFKVVDGHAEKAYYSLDNVNEQIKAYVQDAIRSQIATLDLDDTYSGKEEVATEVQSLLQEKMEQYGYQIVATLITDIAPDRAVKTSMNNINASLRDREAAKNKADADKIIAVKQAEGEAEAKKLAGEGVANQRKAIAQGLVDQREMFRAEDMSNEELTAYLLSTQYIDTMREVGTSPNAKLLMLPNEADAGTAIMQSILTANEATKD